MRAGFQSDGKKIEAVARAAANEAASICAQAPNWAAAPSQTVALFDRLAKLADRQIRQLTDAGVPVACKQGCDACCHSLVTCTWVEARAMEARIRAEWSAAQIEALKVRLAEYGLALAQELPEGALRFRRPCVFLEHGSCLIYPWRPLLCRGLSSWDQELCAAWKNERAPNYVIASPNGESLISTMMQQSVASATGAPGAIVPMALALGHLFGVPRAPSPPDPGWLRMLGEHRITPDPAIGEFDHARTWEPLDQALRRLEPWSARRALAGLFVPDAYRDETEIEASFARLDSELEMLENSAGSSVRDLYDVLEIPRFVIYGYAGRPLKPLMARIGRFFEDRIARPLAPDLLEPMPKRRPGRIRVGFASFHLRNSNAANWSLGWLRNLDRERFETFAIKLVADPDAFTFHFKDAAEHFLILEGDRIQAARYLRSLDLDYLIYPVLGDEGQNHQFAIFRLARRQAAGWGCPFTSGMPQIDDYLSGELTEPEDGESQYSEQLVRLPGNGLTYPKLPEVLSTRTRADFGLPDGHLVGITQNLSKWLPRHDSMLAEISQRLENPLFVSEFGSRIAVETFKERMRAVGARIKYLPMASVPTFLRIAALFDLSLDAPEWHGGHSSFSSLQFGTPVLSMLGSELRSRMALGFQARVGIPDAIVPDRAEFIEKATDPHWQQEARARIHAEGLFDALEPVRGLERCIEGSFHSTA